MVISFSALLFINIEALCAEALAHSPSQMPLSCPVASPSQRELHKDGGGGGGGVAMRARAARAPKTKSCATSCGTSSATPCTVLHVLVLHVSPKGRRVGGLASGSPHAAAYLLFFLKGCVRRVLNAIHVSTANATGCAAPTKGFKRSKSARR